MPITENNAQPVDGKYSYVPLSQGYKELIHSKKFKELNKGFSPESLCDLWDFTVEKANEFEKEVLMVPSPKRVALLLEELVNIKYLTEQPDKSKLEYIKEHFNAKKGFTSWKNKGYGEKVSVSYIFLNQIEEYHLDENVLISCGRPFDWGARIIHTDCNNTIHNSFFGMENKGDNPGLLLLMNLMLTSLDDKKSITKINDLNNFVVNAIMSQYGHYYLNEYSKIRNDFKDLPFTFIQYPILTEFAKMLDSEYSINLNIEIDNRINKKVPLRKAKPNEKIFSSSIELFSKYYDKIFELCDKSLSKAIDSY